MKARLSTPICAAICSISKPAARSWSRDRAPDRFPRIVNALAFEHAVGAGEIDVLEDAQPLWHVVERLDATHTAGTDDDDLARLDIAHELGADDVEGARLRGNNPGI